MALPPLKKALRKARRKYDSRRVQKVKEIALKSLPLNPALARDAVLELAKYEMWRMAGGLVSRGKDGKLRRRHPGPARLEYRMGKWGVRSVEEFAERILKWKLPKGRGME